MKTPVLSLWQPYASMIFHGLGGKKVHETRHFLPPAKLIGQRFAIHAALKIDRPQEPEVLDVLHRLWGRDWRDMMITGAVLGTVKLVGAYSTEACEPANDYDRLFGNWGEGRYAWRLDDVRCLPEPLPAKGRQSWWSIDLPEGA